MMGMSPPRKTDNLQMNIYLHTIQDLVGPNGLKSILNYAHLEKYIDAFPLENDELEIPVEDLKYLYHSLIDLFGSKGARSLQLRVGQQVMKYALEKLPSVLKALQLSSRILPESKKMRLVLEKFVEESEKRWVSPFEGPHTELQEEKDCFLIIERDCFLSEDIISQTPVCFVYVGELDYLVYWITGHRHEVKEIECRTLGHSADVFKIWKVRNEKN
jgi:predicted hydrocarbon binding protein